MDVYKKALRKGKQKIPRCNLLILGEERTGKTSVYRLLVGKKFNPDQDSTRGIDNTVVETVDKRHVDSDTWEEKTSDDQKHQSKKLFALGVAKEVRKELPVNKQKVATIVPTKKKLVDEVRAIKKALDAENENVSTDVPRVPHPQHQYGFRSSAGPKESGPMRDPKLDDKPPRVPRESGELTVSSKTTNEVREAQPKHPHTSDKDSERKAATVATIATAPVPKKASEAKHSNKVAAKKKVNPTATPAIQLSRGHVKAISKIMKSGANEDGKLPLTYNALDFAGQKEYHPMHHCFITRRALYLVVFNLQKMMKYINERMSATDNPLEQIRYWLHSIHAHVFPPNKVDHMRRVCLVGTHRAPPDCEAITEEQLKLIDNELRSLERDDRCLSHFHYTGNEGRIYVAVENSMTDCKESGVLELQSELKKISDKLSFLKEDHPIIWLNFEAQLIEECNVRNQRGSSVVVSLKEVSDIAYRQGLDEDQRLALDFFHDTGKIICLGELPF